MNPSGKPRTLFFSAGEPSGDLHAATLIHTLQQQSPDLRCVGFGGDRMAAAGCQLMYPLCDLALMGFFRVLAHLKLFFRLAHQADAYFRSHRPDAVVLIDYPGFNWHIARRAHDLGIPVFYFVPPQIWAWANWRVRKLRRWVDHVLCTLPFEQPWYRARGVDADYIGHPYFDDLRQQLLDEAFVAQHEARPGTLIGILPGSRRQEIANNLTTQLRAAAHVHRQRPDTRFLVACFRKEHADRTVRQLRELFPAEGATAGSYADGLRGGWSLPVEVYVGRTAEIIHLAHSCMAVSGSVSLELLFRGKPAVVSYRLNLFTELVYATIKTTRFIGLVNLIADRELFPEYVNRHCEAKALADHVLRWLSDRAAYETLCGELSALREQVAEAGACARAAARILAVLDHEGKPRQVA